MRTSISSKNKTVFKILIIVIWLAVWEAASRIVNNGILLAGPVKVFKCLMIKIFESAFWLSILKSFSNIAYGFLLGVIFGTVLAVLSYKSRIIKEFLSPFMAFIKATPVASFIVLFLIWWSSARLSVAISACVVLPQIYVGMLQGLENIDGRMLKMADCFGFGSIDRIHYIYRPGIRPYMEGAVKVAAAMAWKSGIAAEVIGTPDGSIGEKLYMSKIFLETESVLAWTVVIIVLSVISEYAVLNLYKLYNRIDFKCQGCRNSVFDTEKITLEDVRKQYGDNVVFDGLCAEYSRKTVTTLEWESGAGKSTLFRIISGEESADGGSIMPEKYETSVLYQDDRLCEEVSAVKNIELVTGNREKAEAELMKLLSAEDIYKPVKELSGGQKRRVAIVRCIVKNADVFLLDEPFNGLDEANRTRVSNYIYDSLKNKIVIIASHISGKGDVN